MLRKDVHKDEICISGRFVYTSKHKPLGDGHARTDAYVDGRRRLGARFFAKGLKEAIWANDYCATSQLRNLRVYSSNRI